MSKKVKIIIGVSIPLIIAAALACLVLTDTILVGKSSKDGSLWIGSSDYAKSGQLYLVGEAHSKEVILAEELKLWQDLYHNEGMRNFFVEYPHYTAQFLNIWMQEEGNETFDYLFGCWEGTQAHAQCTYDFYMAIKETCPETVFHGTDVGHQYKTIGAKYKAYLEEKGLTDTEDYRLTLEAIEQGKTYYNEGGGKNHDFREQKMFENLENAYNRLNGLSIFGVYGSAHINYPAMGWNCTETYNMTTAFIMKYGRDIVELNNLSQKLAGQY